MGANIEELESLLKEKGLPVIIEKKSSDWAMFWFVTGMRKALPAVTIERAVEAFLKYTNTSKNIGSAVTQYARMRDEFIESLRK